MFPANETTRNLHLFCIYHLVMTNIAMENPDKWRFLAGKIIYKWGSHPEMMTLTLWLFNSSPWKWPIEIDDFPSERNLHFMVGIFQFVMFITRWDIHIFDEMLKKLVSYLYIPYIPILFKVEPTWLKGCLMKILRRPGVAWGLGRQNWSTVARKHRDQSLKHWFLLILICNYPLVI